MKKLVYALPVVLCAVLILSACGSQTGLEEKGSSETVNAGQVESLTDVEQDEEALRDNYYRYVNRDYLENTKVPEGGTRWGYIDILTYDNFEAMDVFLDDIVENRDDLAKGSDDRMIADFYLTLCDIDTRNSAGLGPFQEYIDRIQNAATVQELIELDGEKNRNIDFAGLLEVDSKVDDVDASRYSRLIYGNYSFLRKEELLDESFDDLRPSYEVLLAEFLKRAGYDDTDAAFYASEIVDFQVGIAPYGLDLLDLTLPEMCYNVYTVEELDDLFSNIDIAGFLKTSELDRQEYQIVYQPDLCAKINEVLIDDDLDFLKAYESCMTVFNLRNFIDIPLNESWLSFTEELYGRNGDQDLGRCFRECVETVFGTEFGKMYVEKYFSEEDKQAVTEMAENIIDKYRERLADLDWMADSTKESALEKLDNLVLLIGYPDEWDCYYGGTEIKGPDEGGILVDNVYAICRADAEHEFETVNAPVDRKMWAYNPQNVNAYCNYNLNIICFPAGILQAPYYSADASPEENYGGIGFNIAHEITHLFDSNGSLYDANGNAKTWWTDKDYENFEALTQKVIDYYDSLEFNGKPISGTRTINENIADLGAIGTISSFFEDDPEALDRLFRYFALTMADVSTDAYTDYIISTDEHAPNEVRVNAVLRNLDCFYDAYPEITEGDGMYLTPEDRIKIW